LPTFEQSVRFFPNQCLVFNLKQPRLPLIPFPLRALGRALAMVRFLFLFSKGNFYHPMRSRPSCGRMTTPVLHLSRDRLPQPTPQQEAPFRFWSLNPPSHILIFRTPCRAFVSLPSLYCPSFPLPVFRRDSSFSTYDMECGREDVSHLSS